MVNTALNYLKWGLSVIPTLVTTKQPVVPWKKYQSELPTESFLKKYFSASDFSIAMICGKVSGNIELIDIDNHFGDAKQIYETWKELVINTGENIFEKLVIETTQNGGYHIIYRCSAPGKNSKLARRQKSEKEVDTIIETRGEGGYAIIAPSKGYVLLQNDFDKIPVLTDKEREILIAVSCSFNEFVKEDNKKDDHKNNDTDEERPGTIYNKKGDVTPLLQEYGWTLTKQFGDKQHWARPGKESGVSATFNVVKDKLYVFSTNCHPFENDKYYDKFSIYANLKHNGDYAEAVKDLVSQGYGSKKSKTKKETKLTIKKQKNTEIEQKDTEPEEEIEEREIEFDFPKNIIFWHEKEIAKETIVLMISKAKLIKYLEYHGYGKYWIDRNISAFIKIEDNIVFEETTETIIDFLKKQIAKMPFWITQNKSREDLWEAVLQKIQTYKASDFLSTLEAKELNIVRDQKDKGYFFFQNCIVETNKEMVKTLSYKEVEGHIWNEQIIKHNFTLLPGEDAADTSNSMFGKFLERVCSPANKEYPEDREKRTVDEERLASLCSAIGYLLHTYKDPTLTKAVILCEEKIAGTDESNGRTGKGLTYNAITKLRKHVYFNGKNIDFHDRFFYQNVSPDTQLMVFDDVKKNFNFENLFSVLTEGMIIEKKGLKSITIPFNETPKIIITTNNVISNDTDSHKARKFEIEFSDYYTADYTPIDDLGGRLYEEGWETGSQEWTKFFNLMIWCVQHFLNCGLMKYKTVNLDERKLRDEVPEEFLEMAEEWIKRLRTGAEVNKAEIYNTFIEENPIWGPKGKKSVTQVATSKWFKKILKFYNVPFTEKQVKEGISIRKYYVATTVLNYVEPQELPLSALRTAATGTIGEW